MSDHHDIGDAVIVPALPGPIVRVRDLDRGRDEIDEVLDDLFGEPDDRGPGAVDAVLVGGGLAAIVAGQAASLATAVTVCGAAALALGAVLPVRSLWRRLGAKRRAHRLQSLLGDGTLLRVDHASTERLLVAHNRLSAASAPLSVGARARVHEVAHSMLAEVATLLAGRPPASRAEVDYVDERAQALERLGATVVDPRVHIGEHERRQALVEARREIEQLTGSSSLTDAADLSRDLLGIDDA